MGKGVTACAEVWGSGQLATQTGRVKLVTVAQKPCCSEPIRALKIQLDAGVLMLAFT